ncbi:ATP-NAD kinase family protein [Gilvimarinus sp. SDUM040013]|uniref:ATP-NAD kinase family protein n=1 Tax=Gilvimarinus gilvus TaxID=3058038 RepID=A0ABU4S419_9GAMM|nr:ATP-NAD kinase family protein [Gilvimarinus sp. SDUM040013]MDO3385423.1 ATP-NAD kinase family protein [Gilvimarinus sp. SDUM040013]MDX6851316.1 ATP-NAD kinase family protein [Gilvimarinus sp. SDUM040013]
MLKLGVIINPYAGIGGSVALKGSDGVEARDRALQLGAKPRAAERMLRALAPLEGLPVKLYGYAGDMGAAALTSLPLPFEVVGRAATVPSSAQDTQKAARALKGLGVDLIVFAGGDGTARSLADAIGCNVPVLGVPSGVKIHSGVYAISPEAAGRVLCQLAAGCWAPLVECEVRDIDETAFREGRVRARHYAEMRVPMEAGAIQQVKNAGAEVDELAQADIAADVAERMDSDSLYLIGPGSTTRAVMTELGLESTLLGVDVVKAGQLLAGDATEAEILALMQSHRGPVVMVVTAIGGQGHILGRGNQQFSPAVVEQIGRDNIWVVATADKLKALEGRPLLVDSNSPQLDRQLAGLLPVICGYHQEILYPVGGGHEPAG